MQRIFLLIDAVNELLAYYNEKVDSTAGYSQREIVERSKECELIQKS